MPAKKTQKTKSEAVSTKPHEQGKTVAILSYILVGIVWYFTDKSVQSDAYAKHHVKQALVLFVFCFIISILTPIPLIGWIIIGPIGSVILAILFMVGILQAASDSKSGLPVIGKLADKWFTF